MWTYRRAPAGPRVAVAGQRRDEGAEVQRPGGRGRESAGDAARRTHACPRRGAPLSAGWRRRATPTETPGPARSDAGRRTRRWGTRASEAAVVAAQRVGEVAALAVEVVAQDHAAVAQVGALVEEVLPRRCRSRAPERHHLHVAARAGRRDRVLPEAALDVDHREDEARLQPRPHRLVADHGQQVPRRFLVLEARQQPGRHGAHPRTRVQVALVHGGAIVHCAGEGRAHRGREHLVLLRAAKGERRRGRARRRRAAG